MKPGGSGGGWGSPECCLDIYSPLVSNFNYASSIERHSLMHIVNHRLCLFDFNKLCGLVGETLACEPDDHKVAGSNPPTFYQYVFEQDP